MTLTKWLIYTVLIGLLPFIARLLIFAITKNLSATYILNEVDMIAFGLVLNVSNISEIDNNSSLTEEWKTKNKGLSVIFIIIFSIFLGLSYMADLPNANGFDKNMIRMLSLCLSAVSLFFSYTIFNKLG
ncbi:MAG: hypothetical protein EOO85_02695 [Pedobacter sp.]|nr:MAG: hypothetical protein EOO85_02695 [Pedobacter sp.]